MLLSDGFFDSGKSGFRRVSFLKAFFLSSLILFSFASCAFLMDRVYPPRVVGVEGEEKVVLFQFYAPAASSVYLVGDFNSWGHPVNGIVRDPDALMEFNETSGLWEKRIKLRPGRYEYKYVIDGYNWVSDPSAELYAPNGNPVIIVR